MNFRHFDQLLLALRNLTMNFRHFDHLWDYLIL